jgi:sulfur transfer protein SufE
MHNFVENDEKVPSYIYIIYCSIMSQKTSREKTTWRQTKIGGCHNKLWKRV